MSTETKDKATVPLKFKVSSALKSIIGKDLITNDFVAIFELVKNSFDASATNIDILFDLNSSIEGSIYIVDNGKGMSYQDILEKWLFLAYSAKNDGSEDESNTKVYAGNKGVGRFSCDRLGSRLKVQSKVESEAFINVLDVDWEAFEANSKTLFSDVSIQYSKSSSFEIPNDIKVPENGVVIEILGVKDKESWDRDKFLKLKRHLAKLIDPFGGHESDTVITLHCRKEKSKDDDLIKSGKEIGLVNGPIENKIFSALLEKTTSLKVYIDNKSELISELVDRGELIYKIKEKIDGFSELRDSGFSAELFYLNQSAKLTFSKRMSLSVNNFGSVFVFRNGFRVFPIGEKGDDYWGMDARKQQGYARFLGTRDLIGRVDIAGPESKFKEASSRDKGLIETRASKQLDEMVWDKCIKRIESYVVGVQWKDALDKTNETPERIHLDSNRNNLIHLITKLARSNNVELLDYNTNLIGVLTEKSKFFEASVESLESLATKIGNASLLNEVSSARKRFVELKTNEQEAIQRAQAEFEARKKAEQKAEEERLARKKAEEAQAITVEAYENEKKRNYFLLSSGSRDKDQLESFLHQIIIYAANHKQGIANLLQDINRKGLSSIPEKNIVNFLADQQNTIEKIITTSRFATSANFILDSAEVEADISIFISQYLEKICTAYNSGITISVTNTAKELIKRFTPIELGMVLDNFVNNSKKAKSSVINFNIKNEGNTVLLMEINDDGLGLAKSIIEPDRIFEKGYTTTRGSGLGLYFCKTVVEKLGGEIIISPIQPKFGIAFEMRFQK